ncbi:MAG: flagellar basal-body MS-ring/collar protein FliF [Moraxellaceae bacterium]|nr:flagellar basal-body MS-ring/collar protein FliF [Moraxellaceae bacterium]
MADARITNLLSQGSQLAAMPWMRQLLVMVAIAASVAVGVAAVMWSQGPDYRVLYASLEPDRAAAVIEGLDANRIRYRLDQNTGAIMVPANQLHEARLKMASAGVIKPNGTGLEMIQEEKGFGVSEFMETKKYQHALETELSRTIESMHQVRRARVHLAMPRQSVFVRERRAPSASILLDVSPGASLDKNNVKAIINLVASSIPELKADQVTVVDQQGNLLSRLDENNELEMGTRQFEYRQAIERAYEIRIADLLSDITASGKVRVQVAADIDFSAAQESRESFNPDKQVIRSEQILRDNRSAGGNANAQGVPGALSNQPPTAADMQAMDELPEETVATSNEPTSIVRNYEIERVLNYVNTPAGSVRRLSVAVVVDNARKEKADGTVISVPTPADDIEQLTKLVRDAIGFDEQRGDRVTVMAADFRPLEGMADADGISFWQEAWFSTLLKQVLVGLGLLALVLGVLKPAVKSLLVQGPANAMLSPEMAGQGGTMAGHPQAAAMIGSDMPPNVHRLPPVFAGQGLEARMGVVHEAVASDPRIVAQVVKNWVNDSAGT